MGVVVSRGQPLSFWERVWSSAIELPVLVPTIIGGDRNAQIYDLTALNAESAEQMALLHLTRLFPRRKEAGHARLWELMPPSLELATGRETNGIETCGR